MLRFKLLAAAFSIMVGFADEFSWLKSESPEPVKEVTTPEAPPQEVVIAEDPILEPATLEPASLVHNVTATVYFPELGQTDGDPLVTADGSKINEKNPRRHRWIAVSRDLHSRWGGQIEYGDSLVVSGISNDLDGIYIVRDTMNKRIKNRIDILVGRQDKLMGFWKDVQISKVE